MQDQKPKVFIDPAKCCGAGMCMATAPLSFEVGPERITVGINPFGDSLESVLRAIDECPMQAISLVNDTPADPRGASCGKQI